MKCDIRTCKRVTYDTIRSVLIGTLTGLAITFFANTVSFLGNLNEQYPALLLLLPFASCITLKIYQKLGDAYRRITVEATFTFKTVQELLGRRRSYQNYFWKFHVFHLPRRTGLIWSNLFKVCHICSFQVDDIYFTSR